MSSKRMKVEEQGGINWTWFKVQNGNLVAVFRLHHGEKQLRIFRELERGLEGAKIDVPFATWREPCDVIANHHGKESGYSLPEVKEAFGWLAEMFKGAANGHELESCADDLVEHLEYHGVAVCRI